MVLHHVANGPCFFVISAATFQTYILCYNDFGILAGRSRKIKDTIAGGATLLINGIQQRGKFLIAFYIMEVGLQVINTRSKTLPYLWVDRLLTAVLIDRFERLFAELIVAIGTPRESYN